MKSLIMLKLYGETDISWLVILMPYILGLFFFFLLIVAVFLKMKYDEKH